MNSANLLLAAHDAGGAQVLSSWALAHPEHAYRFSLEGPAISVFAEKLGPIANLDRIEAERELDRRPPDLLVTGTSWQSDMERRVRDSARGKGIRTAAYLDHWVNYRERFGFPGPWLEKLPDEIWCPDAESLEVCGRDGFPADRLVLKGNPYLDGIVAGMRDPAAAARPGTVLYVCEPQSEHMEKAHGNPMHLGYDEFTALRHFFSTVSGWARRPGKILVRPHPSERTGKYESFLEEFRPRLIVEISGGSTLAADINGAEMVVGCESMAMVVALKMGKKVFTSIPPAGLPCRLPFQAIRRIDDPSLRASL